MIDTNEIRKHLKQIEFPRAICANLCDHIDELERKLKYLENQLEYYHEKDFAVTALKPKDQQACIDELERKLKIAEDALEYYSNENFYFPRNVIILCNEKRLPIAPVYSDFGETALKALKQIRGEWDGEPMILAETLTEDHINDGATVAKRGE